ncbi:hypothetical protein AURDEDRAFT_162342 [Auricularia subglabra TFB-10046 SS5]|nr:hypothetical protein AURDEDRAFT_162342 [Auricularia subglabra TFB-10046 SS5]
MADKLADETLFAILAQTLAVRDGDFACTTASKSPFASDALSSSLLLLVCKRWMRVATPLLYETVILRSAPQATALAAVLKANPTFGRYIKKVRVEGGVGASICSVFKAAPNITDLALTLDLRSEDNVGSMYKSLRTSVDPHRLVLCSSLYRLNLNKVTTLAVDTLCKCIAEWSSLRVVALSERLVSTLEIYRAICRAPRLHMIHIPRPASESCGSGYLSRLAEQCVAPVVRVGWPARGLTAMLGIPEDRLAELSPLAREKVQFEEPQDRQLDALPINPTFTPLENCPEQTRRSIWTRILELVITTTTGIDEEKLAEDRWARMFSSEDRLPRGPALQCMMVCKEWKDIVTPLACHAVVLSNPCNIGQFAHVALADKASGLRHRVRSIKLCRDTYFLKSEEVLEVEDALHQFLEAFDRLEHFDRGCIRVSPAAFSVLVSALSANLRSLPLRSKTSSVYALRSLPRLTSLRWSTSSRDVKVAFDTPPPSFPALEELALSGYGSSTLLPTLALCGMPALRTLEFDECSMTGLDAFLSAHGKQLRIVRNLGHPDALGSIIPACLNVTSVDVSHCQNLRPLSWPDPGVLTSITPFLIAAGVLPPSREPSPPPAPKPALEEVILPPLDCLRKGVTVKEGEPEIARLDEFLGTLLPEKLPNLRTIRVRQRDIWPTTQRATAKHPLPALAEKMLARGLRIVDEEGVGWKPRLTTATQRKKTG